MAEPTTSISGLSEAEAREFHGLFVVSFILFTLIALVAHIFTYIWRPWPAPLASLSPTDLGAAAHHVLSLLA
jgi:light-harvesting complex 1 beta chain